MKGIRYLALFCVGILSGLLILTFASNGGKNDLPFSLTAPIPERLFNTFPKVLGANDHWYPHLKNSVENQPPTFSAVSGIAYDITEDKLLFSKNEKDRLPIASLTKIMTALLAIENDSLSDDYVVSKNAALTGENAMGLSPGEKLRLKDLLYGMMLPSGNDAAEVIAENSRFGRDEFVFQMNKRAEELGMANTRFSNPSGLEGDGKQYSTAVDLLILSRHAMNNLDFAEIVGTYEYEIPDTKNHKYYFLKNDTNLLTSYPGVKGIKTGFTWEAGMCLVTYLEYDGSKIIAVLLNSQDRRGEMKMLLDYSLRVLGKTPPKHG